MNKTLFTNDEIATLTKVLGNKLQVSINKAGNVKVVNNAEPKTKRYCFSGHGFWTLYKHADGTFLWRRHDGTGYCYPLNMKGRKFKGTVSRVRNEHTGKIEYWGYKPYSIDMSVFNTFEEAMNYFVKYLKKYRNIDL